MRVANSTALSPLRGSKTPSRSRGGRLRRSSPGRLVLVPSSHPVLNDVFGDAEQCLFLLLRPEHRVGEYSRRMDIRIRSSFLDIHERATRSIASTSPNVLLSGSGRCTLVSLTHIGVLVRIGVAVDRASRRTTDTADEAKAGDRRPLVEQLRFGEIAQPKELPPRGLQFPPMPVQEMGQEPARVLLVGALVRDRPARRR